MKPINTSTFDFPTLIQEGFVCVDKTCRLHGKFLIVLGALLVSTVAFGANGTWIGRGADGKWTNHDNWQDGVIPGRLTIDSVSSGQGGDVATFGAVEAGAQTTVDLSGVTSIGGIAIVGAEAPAYVFGMGAQKLNLEADGAGYSVDENVVNAPTIANCYRIVYATTKTPTITIRNESANCVLNLPAFDKETTKDPGYSDGISLNHIDFRGAGDIRIAAVSGYGYNVTAWNLNQTGKLIIGCVLHVGYGHYSPYDVTVGSASAAQGQAARIEIEKDCSWTTSSQYGRYWTIVDNDLEISGEGTFGFHFNAAYDSNNTRVHLAPNRTLTFSCCYEALHDSTTEPGVRAYVDNAGLSAYCGGTIVFAGANAVKGPIQNFYGVMATDQADGFGFGEAQLSEGSTFRYFGDADWTMTQNICITNWPNRTELSGKLETVAGKGVWTIAGGLTQHYSADISATGTFTLTGDGEGVVSGVISNTTSSHAVALAKSGAGTWTLSGANTFTGVTTLNAGTLRVAKTGSLASSSGVTINGGTLQFDGDATSVVTQNLTKITIAANGELKLTGQTAVIAAAISRSAGTLNVVTSEKNAKLIVPPGTTASYLTWNGYPVVITAEGEVKYDADALIAARGDVVPNNGGRVAIFFAGSEGNDTLAADVTSLAKLSQISQTPATIGIGEGQTLAVPSVELGANAVDLTLGATGNTGVLSADASNTLTFSNASSTAAIRLNVAIAETVKTNSVAQGRLVVQGDTTLARTLVATANKATAQVEIRGCTVETGYEPVLIGNNAGNDYNNGGMQYGDLTISNAILRNAADLARAKHTYENAHEYALLVGKNASGTLRVQDGAVVSNKIQIGTGGTSGTAGRGSGAVYQSGGSVVLLGGAEYRQNSLGNNGMGYYELARGSLTGGLCLAGYGIGIWHQEPGTTADMGLVYMSSGNGGLADVYVRGTVYAGTSDSMIVGGHQDGNFGVLTVGDSGYIDFRSKSPYIFVSASVCTSYVNVVQGGAVRAASFYRHAAAYGNAGYASISFDGGTFVSGASTGDIFSNSYNSGTEKSYVDDVVIYKGGFTVDTAGFSGGTSKAMRAPEGKGVSAIPFDYSKFTKWNCPPIVRIYGDGVGATAHALFDSSSQMVTGVVITCAGTGYTTATAKASYKGNSCPSAVEVSCELAANETTGGFTKAGSGTFTLSAANAYGGETVLKGGTLRLNAVGAIPNGSTVVLAGGVLDLNGNAAPVNYAVDGANGSVEYASSLAFPEGATLTVRNVEAMTSVQTRQTLVSFPKGFTGSPTVTGDLPSGWHISLKPTRLTLVPARGCSVFVR